MFALYPGVVISRADDLDAHRACDVEIYYGKESLYLSGFVFIHRSGQQGDMVWVGGVL